MEYMLTPVHITPRPLESYRSSVREGALERLKEDAQPLEGCRVLHVNATAYGGGVAEILASMVPLMHELGIAADWKVITGSDDFFRVTKAMHNSLQGKHYPWKPEDRAAWVAQNRLNAEHWEDYDYVVIHDPQPAPLLGILRERCSPAGRWLWRCHIDLTSAQPEAWDMLRPFVQEYEASIWTMRGYVREGLAGQRVFIAPPAIDPLTPKNEPMDDHEVRRVVTRYGIDPDRPVICQVSRFDPWKDPLGVIDAYRMIKGDFPGLQLVLVGSMAHDDPEGWDWYEKVLRRCGEDLDIKVFTNLNGVGNIEVNAIQRISQVVIQKSTREGFGLVVAEALWKGRPCVAGNAGGIPLQVLDGRTGFLVDSVEKCAEATARLLRDADQRECMGRDGREHVRDNFLITRYLHDYVRMFRELSGDPVAAK
jgi:trehalose synthase